jgi:glycosyltransferase involved in cell wall biosynthesis
MKIAVVHPALMDYRVDLFNLINEEYNATFLFTKQGRGQENVKEEHQCIPLGWKSKDLKTNQFFRRIDIGMQIMLFKELVFGDYDLVISSTSRYTCWLASRIGHKKFMQMTELWAWIDFSMYRRFLNVLNKAISRNSDSIFAMGTKSYNFYLDMGINDNKISMYSQCALDYTGCPIEDLRTSLALQQMKVVMFLGRLVRTKGIEYLLRAFSRLEKETQNTFLVIAGDGPSKKELENLAEDLKIENILFAGTVSKKDIASYYNLCDIFVLPSIFTNHSYEPWGLVVNEAMAFGKPIITTSAVGSGKDLVTNGYNGFVVEDKNADELFESLKYVISNEDVMVRMGDNSRNTFIEINNIHEFYKAFTRSIKIACND